MPSHDTTAFTIVDFAAHVHLYDAEAFTHDLIDAELGEPVYKDLDAMRRRYREAGIDRAVLSQPQQLTPDGIEEARASNDALREAFIDADDRYGLAGVPIAVGGEAAAAELERCLEAGFHGAIVRTDVEGVELHHPAYEPVFAVAERAGAPILVHPKLDDAIDSPVLDDAWRLNAVLGRDAALCASLLKVVHTGVLDRFPGLDLVFHHFGGNVASAMGRFHNQFRKRPPERWESPEPTKPFAAFKVQLEERVHVDVTGYDGFRTNLRAALAEFPVDNLVFGTDFPFEIRTPADFERMIRPVVEELPRAAAERVLSGNALDLLANVE